MRCVIDAIMIMTISPFIKNLKNVLHYLEFSASSMAHATTTPTGIRRLVDNANEIRMQMNANVGGIRPKARIVKPAPPYNSTAPGEYLKKLFVIKETNFSLSTVYYYFQRLLF